MSLAASFADPAGQAWLGLWVELFQKQGGSSRLAGYLNKGDEADKADREETVTVQDRASLARVLQDAPLYFKSVRALRRYLPEDYELFRRIGCVLPPDDSRTLSLARGRIDHYPSFVALICPGKFWQDPSWEGLEAERNKHSNVNIFKRVQFAGAYLPWGDVIYEWLHLCADITIGRGGGEAAYIGVDSATGKARVLPQPAARQQRLPGGEVVTHTHVGVPSWVRLWHRESHTEQGNLHEWVSSVLSIALSQWRSADKGWQVHLTDAPEGGPHPVTMRLCIPERSAKSFFRDREAPDQGRLRPIFHIVAEHERRLGDNRSTTVRQHYRGNRAFDWNGYQTLITVPGHHHNALSSMDWTMRDEEGMGRERGITLSRLGQLLARYVRRASPLHSYRRGY